MLRRDLLRTVAGGAVAARLANAARLTRANVCFITDEVDRNLAGALPFAKEFGIRQVELRHADGRYCFTHEPEKLQQIHALLNEHGIRVAILSTPILKCTLPGFPPTPEAAGALKAAHRDFPIPEEQQVSQQMDFLRKAIAAARILETDKIRIFSYWRVLDREKARPRIIEGLSRVTEVAEKEKIRLCIENEPACNLASCAEMASVLRELSSPYLGMNWDADNGLSVGEPPYPEGFNLLDKSRIWHMHVKDSRRNPETGRWQVCAVGDGVIPWVDILNAMGKAGYSGALSMETHFSINGSRQPASRRSMAGILKVVDQLS
jgi:sugar phosphate isomerase/epimerase